MRSTAGQERNWRDAASYAPLLQADASLLAWEWLRRSPSYREAAEAAPRASTSNAGPVSASSPESWGLHRFEPPDLDASVARPFWRARVHPHVLVAHARTPSDVGDRFDLRELGPIATTTTSSVGEHVLLSDGVRAIRLDVVEGSILCGAVELEYRLGGVVSAQAPLLALRRLLALCRHGTFSAGLHGAGALAVRHILMLRACDAASAGAKQRDIAAELFGQDARDPRWRVRMPSVRSRAQRLVRGGRMLSAGGYLALLRR